MTHEARKVECCA